MRFFDCVDNNPFENYWFFEGVSDRLGYHKYNAVNSGGKVIEILKTSDPSHPLSKTILTIVKLFSLLTVIVPAAMLAGKFLYRWNHRFRLHPQPLSINERITVGTYNILFPQSLDPAGKPAKFSTNIGFSADDKGKLYENSAFRVGIIAKNILTADLDIVCVQEMTDHMEGALTTSLKEKYSLKWIKHQKFHGVGILYKKDKFDLLAEKVLNLTVLMEDSLNPGLYSPSRRVHILQDLLDKTTKKVFRVVSSHMFDPRSLQDIEKQTNDVITFAESDPQGYLIDRTIIAGDMNQDQFGDAKSPPQGVTPSENLATSFKPFIKEAYHVDGNLDSTEYEKKEADKGPMVEKGRCIDWIWVRDIKPEHLPVQNFDCRGSDHALVASVIG